MADKINLKNVSIVLNRPLYSENVGAAARAMRNMGFERLVAVNPKDFDELFIVETDEEKKFTPRLASRHELDGMYDQLKDILVRISYINPENPDHWLNKLRHFFSRIQLRAKEVSIIRGICRQIDWYGKKCFDDGRKTGRIDS